MTILREVNREMQVERVKLIMALRQLGILDTKVLKAIETVPRDQFVPSALRKHAYDNVSLPITHGQTISQPYIVARMTELLALTGRERVLEIGTGTGYQAAIISHLCRRVYSVERLRPLLVEADRLLTALRFTNFTFKLADGIEGWQGAAPFERIILTCATTADRLDILLGQLKPEGILIAPIILADGEQKLQRYYKTSEGVIETESLFGVRFVPLISHIAE